MLTKEDEIAYFREHKIKSYVTEIMHKISERDRRRRLYDDIISAGERNIKPCVFVE